MNAPQPGISAPTPRRGSAWFVVGVVGLAAVLLARPLYWDLRAAFIRSHGARATARILEVRPTGSRFNHDPVAEYRLELEREGQPPGPTGQLTDALSPVLQPRYQPGARVPVYFDPADPTAMAFESE